MKLFIDGVEIAPQLYEVSKGMFDNKETDVFHVRFNEPQAELKIVDGLNDTQIALIIKLALEYNAAIINFASQIYGQDIKPHRRTQAQKDLIKYGKEYNEKVNAVMRGQITK